MTIKSLLLYTTDGVILYDWNNEPILGKAHSKLVPAFFSALDSVMSTIYNDNLQKISLKQNIIVFLGKKISIKDNNGKSKKKFVIMSILAEAKDNTNLLRSIMESIFNLVMEGDFLIENCLVSNSKFENELKQIITSREYNRTSKKVFISSIMVGIATFVCTFIYLLDYDLFLSEFNPILTVPEIIAIFSGAMLILPTSAIAGSVKNSFASGFIGTFIGSSISFVIFEAITEQIYYIEKFGTPLAYFIIIILFGVVYGLLGGFIMEKTYLFTSEPKLKDHETDMIKN